jgi:hypothetical protein
MWTQTQIPISKRINNGKWTWPWSQSGCSGKDKNLCLCWGHLAYNDWFQNYIPNQPCSKIVVCDVPVQLIKCTQHAAVYINMLLQDHKTSALIIKTTARHTYFLSGVNMFLHVGLTSTHSESWFFLRAMPSRQYKDTALFTDWGSIWSTFANCK